MKRHGLLFLLLVFTQIPGLKAVEFSVKEKSVIYTNAIKVLENYQTIINQMGEFVVNDVDKAKSSAEGFLELFVNRQVQIYNDLDPAHKLSVAFEAETYSTNIILWYPDGITVNLDLANAKVSDIMTHEENVFSIDILVKRSINGNYLNQTLNKNVEELLFRIAFVIENKSFAKFRIVGIRSATSNIAVDFSQALKEANSEEFTPEDLSKINSGIKTVLSDYANFLSLIGNPQEAAEDKEFFKTSFLKLFQSSDAKIYNDIVPEPQTSLISLTDYLVSYIAEYPKGINNLSVNTDSLKFGNVMKVAEENYYTYVDAEKFFSGSYKGKDVFRKMFPLKIKVSFTASGKTFTNFLINSIDISSVNYFEATPGAANEQKPEIVIRPVSRKGLGMSLIGSFGQTRISDKDIETMSVGTNLHSWAVSPLLGYISALGVSYYFTDNIAARSGLEFNKYAGKFDLNGKFTDNALSSDVNADKYYKIVDANYDSLVTINYLTIPLLVNYTSGKPGKLGFYGEGGFKISIPIGASFTNTGSYKFTGYYPSHPSYAQYLDEPLLGFYDRQNIDQTGKVKMKGLNLAFYGSFGINIPLGYFSSINIGPELILGLSDILKNKEKYVDIFGKSYTHQPTKIKNFGIRFSFSYKL